MPSYLQNNVQIKLMILYILSEMSQQPSLEELSQVALCDPGVNYFLLQQSLQELEEKENIRCENQRYLITKRGEENLFSCRSELSSGVRKNCDQAIFALDDKIRQEKLTKAQLIENPDGTVLVDLSISDPSSQLFGLQLIVPSKKWGKGLMEAFQNNPTLFLQKIMASAQEIQEMVESQQEVEEFKP